MKATGKITGTTTRIKAVNPEIPNGTYPGRWSAYEVEGEKYVTIVEEKMKAERVVADLRRAMPESMFMSLREAVLSVEIQ